MDDDKNLIVSIDADTTGFELALANLDKQASKFGTTITNALKSAIVSGKSFQDVLRSVGLSLANSALNAGLAPLQNMINGFGSQLISSFAKVTPFAKGGVVSTPTYFPHAGSIGLMGEAGAEAVLPLKRSADGRLGVAAAPGSPTTHVTVNISTPDAGSFKKSSGQIAAALARAVSRGQRGN